MINFAKIWDILITKFPAFMEGVEITLQLAFFTVLFGSLLGLVVAVCRRTRLLPLRWLMNAYVAFIRGTPLLVQVLLVVYGLRSTDWLGSNHGLPELLALAVTGVIHGWKRNSLLSIGCGTLFYMVLVQQIFR